MLRCLILTENPALAASLRMRMTSSGQWSEEQIAVREVGKAPTEDTVYREFNALCDWVEKEIEDAFPEDALPDLLVLTDLGAYETESNGWLTPLSVGGWNQVLGLLILAFPEIHWIFVAHPKPTLPERTGGRTDECTLNDSWHFVQNGKRVEELVCQHETGFVSLLDPTGLRSAIRHCLWEQEKRRGPQKEKNELNQESIVEGIPIRFNAAAAVDEETGYAFLHGYAAYRFGFRSHVVTKYALMKRLFAEEKDYHASLVIEDFFLNFPDYHPPKFSDLATRDRDCPRLTDVRDRVFVTVGLKDQYREKNKALLVNGRTEEKWNRIRYKPLAGIYNLWEQTGLSHRLRGGRVRGYADEFVWPPKPSPNAGSGVPRPHSAPGRLLEVANRLIQRAERLKENIHSPVTAVYGATLAIDALELLADRTPTTGIEALLLKHQFEVLAECQCSGIEYHISIRPRLEEIERETEAISRCFQRGKRETASLNAQMQIINTLIGVLREHNQFDEEQVCMAKARSLHNTIWMRQKPWRFALKPLLRYTEFLLAKLSNVVWAVAGWIIFFTGVFTWIKHRPGVEPYGNSVPLEPFGQTIVSFVSAQPYSSGNVLWQIATVAAVFVGVAHVSMLTAHLYSVMSRK